MKNKNVYAYMRVSTEEQLLDRQESAVQEWAKGNGIEIPPENIFADKISGKTFKREKYLKMKELLQDGDILVVKELDRFGRNWDGIKQEWEELSKRGVKIIIIDMPLLSAKTDESVDNRLIRETMFNMLCYVAQKERDKISQRTKEGLRAKKEQGVVLGRVSKLTQEDWDKLANLYSDRSLKIPQIAELMGWSYPQITKMVRRLVNDGVIEPRSASFGVTRIKGQRKVRVLKGRNDRKLNQEQEDALLVDYYDNNMSAKAVCEKYNIYPNSLHYITHRAVASGKYQPKRKNFGRRKV